MSSKIIDWYRYLNRGCNKSVDLFILTSADHPDSLRWGKKIIPTLKRQEILNNEESKLKHILKTYI